MKTPHGELLLTEPGCRTERRHDDKRRPVRFIAAGGGTLPKEDPATAKRLLIRFRLPAAIDHATRACELTDWKSWSKLDTLAAAYAEAGKFDKAVEFQQKAVETAAQDAEEDRLRERLKLYQGGKPFREAPQGK
jgi:hypothetical protein